MDNTLDKSRNPAAAPKAGKKRLRGLMRSQDGSAAIEFALLAIPYFMIIFAIAETFVAYTAEKAISHAVDTMSRKLRTGVITFNTDATTDVTEAGFRKAFCAEIAVVIRCDADEIEKPNRLWLDVRNFASFANIPDNVVPRLANGDLDTSSFAFSPGAPGSVNILRAYYRWSITTDLVRPYISNIRPNGGTPAYYLMIETSTFKTEE